MKILTKEGKVYCFFKNLSYCLVCVPTRQRQKIMKIINLSTTRGCGVFFPFIFLESSVCLWVKTGAMVHFLGPLGGLVWFSGTSAVQTT